MQFHLFNTGVLLLAREGLRRGVLTGPAATPASVLATAGLAVPLGAAAAGAALAWTGSGLDPSSPRLAALRLQAAAAVVELLAEPLYVLAQVQVRLGVRVAAEAGGTLVRGVVGLALLARGRTDPGIALSAAQLAYAGTVLAVHALAYAREGAAWARMAWARQPGAASARPRRRPSPQSPPLLNPATLRLAAGFGLQAAEKLVLGEGSRAVLAATATPTAQGAYGLAANVGSLAVRTLFQPVRGGDGWSGGRDAGWWVGRPQAGEPAPPGLAKLLAHSPLPPLHPFSHPLGGGGRLPRLFPPLPARHRGAPAGPAGARHDDNWCAGRRVRPALRLCRLASRLRPPLGVRHPGAGRPGGVRVVRAGAGGWVGLDVQCSGPRFALCPVAPGRAVRRAPPGTAPSPAPPSNLPHTPFSVTRPCWRPTACWRRFATRVAGRQSSPAPTPPCWPWRRLERRVGRRGPRRRGLWAL